MRKRPIISSDEVAILLEYLLQKRIKNAKDFKKVPNMQKKGKIYRNKL